MWTRVAIALVGLLLLAVGGLAVFLYLSGEINDRGSPELAREWRDQLVAIQNPDDARRVDPTIAVKRFDDGSWILGLSSNSHGLLHRGGGTMVLRDSRGQVETHFLHVCGPTFCEGLFHNAESIDQVYENVKRWRDP